MIPSEVVLGVAAAIGAVATQVANCIVTRLKFRTDERMCAAGQISELFEKFGKAQNEIETLRGHVDEWQTKFYQLQIDIATDKAAWQAEKDNYKGQIRVLRARILDLESRVNSAGDTARKKEAQNEQSAS